MLGRKQDPRDPSHFLSLAEQREQRERRAFLVLVTGVTADVLIAAGTAALVAKEYVHEITRYLF
jgi:hypothetical protein